MGPFLSHVAKALLIIMLLAHAGTVRAVHPDPVPAAPGSGDSAGVPDPVLPAPRTDVSTGAPDPVVPAPRSGDSAGVPDPAPAAPGSDGPANGTTSSPTGPDARPAGNSIGPDAQPAGNPRGPEARPPADGPGTAASPVSPEPVYRLQTGAREVVLTIDDGPSHLTEQFLEVLAAEDVPAVFFWITGSRRLPLAAEVVGRGHQLATHTITHARLTRLDPEEAAAQISGSKAALEEAAGTPLRFFRPPYGDHDRLIRETAAAHGLATVLWTVDSRDWALADDPDQIIANVMAEVKPGAIILIHERPQTLDVLPGLIRALREAGYTFVPLPEPPPLAEPDPLPDPGPPGG